MATNHTQADSLIKSAQKMRREAEKVSDETKSAALLGEATVDVLLAIFAELRNASDAQIELNKALQRHGAIMEEAANTMMRAARRG